MKRHVVLIGLPGVGKTTVGRLLAERLGATFMDPDAVVVRKMGMPVARVFAEFGESRFRELEREAVRDALRGDPAVIAPGGGWSVQPGEIEKARMTGCLVYLKATGKTAAHRAEIQGSIEARPLLAGGGDPGSRMAELLKEREGFYSRADHEVKTDNRTAEAVAADVEAIARRVAGW